MRSNYRSSCGVLSVTLAVSMGCFAQANDAKLPNAPEGSRTFLFASAQSAAPASAPLPPPPPQPGGPSIMLTRQDAEKIALANNPHIQITQLIAKVQHQAVRVQRADELPNLSGSLTGVEANDSSRLSSGDLQSSRLFNHGGGGLSFSQLITDFGHTRNLVASARLLEKARLSDAEASREDIVLAADQVFFQTVEAQETLQVAEQTVAARQSVNDQVTALTSSKLRSDLDQSFSQVNLSQSKLLELNAQNGVDAAKAALSSVLGYDHEVNYQVVDSTDDLPPMPPNADVLITQAIQNRPDLQALRLSEEAARKFSRAQHEQLFPTISALGVAGRTFSASTQFFNNNNNNYYGAIGGNLSIPIFEGFRLTAEASQAALQAQAATQQTRALRDEVVRDVRTAWLNANTAMQRVIVAGELMKEANTALDLAKTRYNLGLSSIVELSQAELQQTQAAIGDASARSQYNFAIAAIRFQTGVQP